MKHFVNKRTIVSVLMLTACSLLPLQVSAQDIVIPLPAAQAHTQPTQRQIEAAEDLATAIRSLDIELVRQLIDSGTNVNIPTKYTTLIGLAAGLETEQGENIQRQLAIFDLLIAKGANIYATSGLNEHTPIHRAAVSGNCHIIDRLLDKGVDINTPAIDESTPLMLTIRGNTAQIRPDGAPRRKDCAAELINKGADIKKTTSRGFSAMSIAVGNGKTDVLRTLIAKGLPVNADGSEGRSMLMIAAANLQLETVKLLLDNGADVNARNKTGTPALFFTVASDSKNRELMKNGSPTDIVRLLIERGADINAENDQGNTALMTSIHRENTDVMRLLLKNKANPNAIAKRGLTPLRLAASKAEFVKLLLDHGADPHAAGPNGAEDTFMREVFQRGYPDTIKLLIERKLDRKKDGSKDNKYALIAARQPSGGSVNLLQILLDTGTDVNAADDNGTTLLMAAASAGNDAGAGIWLLLDKGAEIDKQDKDGKTALIHAANIGNVSSTRSLLERGANPDIRDSANMSARDYAQRNFDIQDQLTTNRRSSTIHKQHKKAQEVLGMLDGSTAVKQASANVAGTATYIPQEKVDRAIKGTPVDRSVLARLYYYGLENVPQNFTEAYYWLSICDRELQQNSASVASTMQRKAQALEDHSLAGQPATIESYYSLLVDPQSQGMCAVLLHAAEKKMTPQERQAIQPRIDAWFAARPAPQKDPEKEKAIQRVARLARAIDADVYDINGIAAIIAAGADIHMNPKLADIARRRKREDIVQLLTLVASGTPALQAAQKITQQPARYIPQDAHKQEAVPHASNIRSIEAMTALRYGSPDARSKAIKEVMAAPGRYTPPALKALSEALFAQFKDNEAVLWYLIGHLRESQAQKLCPRKDNRSFLLAAEPRLVTYYKHMKPEEFSAFVTQAVTWSRQAPHEYNLQYGIYGSTCVPASEQAAIIESAQSDFVNFIADRPQDAPDAGNSKVVDLLPQAESGDAQAQFMLYGCYSKQLRCTLPNDELLLVYDVQAEQERAQASQSAKQFSAQPAHDAYTKKAWYWLSKSAAQKYAHAMQTQANIYLHGNTAQPKDDQKACAVMKEMQKLGLSAVYALVPQSPWSKEPEAATTPKPQATKGVGKRPSPIEMLAWAAVQHTASGDTAPFNWKRSNLTAPDIEEAKSRAAKYTEEYVTQKKPVCPL